MKIQVSRPLKGYCTRYNCAGLYFESITPIKKYIKLKDDNLFFEYKANEVDHKMLVRMLNFFPPERVLRFGSDKMLANPMTLYLYNKNQKTKKSIELIHTLYESLMIYFTIKKYAC